MGGGANADAAPPATIDKQQTIEDIIYELVDDDDGTDSGQAGGCPNEVVDSGIEEDVTEATGAPRTGACGW